MADPFLLPELISYAPSPPVGATSGMLTDSLVRLDREFGGNYRIVGTVKEKATPTNLPLHRQVVLHEMRSHLPIAEAWSDAAGNYTFEYITNEYTYYVVAFDYENNYRAVVADNLTPELMP